MGRGISKRNPNDDLKFTNLAVGRNQVFWFCLLVWGWNAFGGWKDDEFGFKLTIK